MDRTIETESKLDRLLTTLDRWVARPVAIAGAFATIFGVLIWCYNQLLATSIAIELVPVHLEPVPLPRPPEISLRLPDLLPKGSATSLLIADILVVLVGACIVAVLNALRNWRSVAADVLAALAPPAYGIGFAFLVGQLVVGQENYAGNLSALLVGACIAAVSGVAWFRFASWVRVELRTGKAMGWLAAFYHTFWVQICGLAIAATWTALGFSIVLGVIQ